MSIELRLSDVAPPAPDPPRTIYRDVLNLPDPVKLGITIRYFNYDDVDLYFQITASKTGYTFGAVNLGLLASGADAYRNLDEFGSRAKPSAGEFTAGEFDEPITLILKAYTDAGYTDLKWTHERTVTVHWIKSDDVAWTQDVLNDFDDGTVQGWAVVDEFQIKAGFPTLAVATDYVLSAPYSLKMTSSPEFTYAEARSRLYKSFTTPDKPVVYAILNLRQSNSDPTHLRHKYVQVQRDGSILVFVGKPYNTAGVDDVPKDKWLRIVVPLPPNTALELRVVQDIYSGAYVGDQYFWLWMDDFKIVSK